MESPPFLLFIIRYKYVNRVISFSKVYVLLRNMIVRHTRYCILYIVTIFIGTPSEGITLILLRLNRDIYLQWFIVKPCSSEIKTLLARLCFFIFCASLHINIDALPARTGRILFIGSEAFRVDYYGRNMLQYRRCKFVFMIDVVRS